MGAATPCLRKRIAGVPLLMVCYSSNAVVCSVAEKTFLFPHFLSPGSLLWMERTTGITGPCTNHCTGLIHVLGMLVGKPWGG